VLIGKFFGVRDLGLYSRADNTKQTPLNFLTGILVRVAFPVFSAASEDKEQLKRGVRIALRSMMLINVPMMFGLAAVAEPLIFSLFGNRWLAAVPFFQVLCLGGALHPLQVINLNVLSAQGHSKLFFRLEIIKLVLGLALLAGGLFFGMMGIAWSQVVMCVLGFGINAYYTKRYLNYGVVAQTRDVLPVMVAATVMALTVTWVRWLLPLPPVASLMIMSALGALVFVGACWLFKLDVLHNVIQLLRGRRPQVT
jgi:O-antigen/teichoic acid export membrane protein